MITLRLSLMGLAFVSSVILFVISLKIRKRLGSASEFSGPQKIMFTFNPLEEELDERQQSNLNLFQTIYSIRMLLIFLSTGVTIFFLLGTITDVIEIFKRTLW